jgi:coproporphyrinogen III oxidase-like Fe-S oxidoreductase
MELLPSLVTDDYLRALATMGFTKVSIGVESLQEEVLRTSGRGRVGKRRVAGILDTCASLGLWCNVDMMVGLPNQDRAAFLDDVREISRMSPSQVTIYPYMTVRNASGTPSMPDSEQFRLIEEAGECLMEADYLRKGVWAFATGADIYDSSRDELVTDYAGFGPAAFSTYGSWKSVNPGLGPYLAMYDGNGGTPRGLVARKSEASDQWRRFARMVYDLRCTQLPDAPAYINAFTMLLALTGYARNGRFTAKGVMFAHELTKTVVENLPFPLQNPSVVENWGEYESCCQSSPRVVREPSVVCPA